MPDPVSWYTLGRTVSDPQLIMEMIDEKLLAHNEEPAAHGQTSEAVYVHRNDEEFDHPQYTIYNIKLSPSTRTVKAFCDAGGAAEFERIQDAIDYVHGEGGGKIFIKKGTYTPTATIILYSNVELEGEDKDTTILDFSGKSFHGITITGTVEADIVNVRIRELTIKEVNETATNYGIYIRYADNIEIERCYFTENRNEGFDSSRGDIKIGLNVSDRTTSNIAVSDCVAENSGNFVEAYGTSRIYVRNNLVDSNESEAIDLCNCADGYISFNRVLNLGLSGIVVRVQEPEAGLGRIVIEGNTCTSAGSTGIYVYSALGDPAQWVTVIGNVIIDSNIRGIRLFSAERCTVIGNVIINTTTNDGIELDGSSYNTISGNTVTGADDYGIELFSGSCIKNVVVCNQLLGNTLGGLQDSGSDTEVGHNLVA